MIIFSTKLPNEESVSLSKDKLTVLNLCSLYYGFDNLKILYNLPYNDDQNNIIFKYADEGFELQYDINYHSQLINNPIYFCEFFEKVILPSMSDYVIIILVSNLDSLVFQSFMKFLQIRYDYKCYICNNCDEINEIIINESNYIGNIYNYDYDYIRYSNYLMTSYLEPSTL